MPPGPKGRPPDPSVDARIRATLKELLFERGLELTYEDVAGRAGVGRTTVFRRYPTKNRLLLEAFAQVSVERLRVADTGSTRTDLCAFLSEVTRIVGTGELRRLLRQTLGEACRDSDFTGLLRAVLDARMELVDTVVDRGIRRGDLPDGVDRPLLADLFSGVIALRLASDAALPDENEVARLVDGVLGGFCTATRAPAGTEN